MNTNDFSKIYSYVLTRKHIDYNKSDDWINNYIPSELILKFKNLYEWTDDEDFLYNIYNLSLNIDKNKNIFIIIAHKKNIVKIIRPGSYDIITVVFTDLF